MSEATTIDMNSRTVQLALAEDRMDVGRDVQLGPVYYCPDCGKMAKGVVGYIDFSGSPGALGQWAEHVAYLDLHDECRRAKHQSRVARLGDAVIPLGRQDEAFSGHRDDHIEMLRQALRAIVNDAGTSHVHHPVVAAVYRAAAGVIAPQEAVEQIQESIEAIVKRELGASLEQEQ